MRGYYVDTVVFLANVKHWYGATYKSWFSHIKILTRDRKFIGGKLYG